MVIEEFSWEKRQNKTRDKKERHREKVIQLYNLLEGDECYGGKQIRKGDSFSWVRELGTTLNRILSEVFTVKLTFGGGKDVKNVKE